MKCANFVNLSTTTRMIVYPSDLGNPSIKSIDKSCQTAVGIGVVVTDLMDEHENVWSVDKYCIA